MKKNIYNIALYNIYNIYNLQSSKNIYSEEKIFVTDLVHCSSLALGALDIIPLPLTILTECS